MPHDSLHEAPECCAGACRLELAVLRAAHEALVARIDREAALRQQLAEAETEKAILIEKGHAALCDQRFDAFLVNHVHNHEHEHETQQHALETALTALNDRLHAMNQFREQMALTETRFATKADLVVVEAKLATSDTAISDRLRLNEEAVAALKPSILGPEFRTSTDQRFRFLERMVWMGLGAITVMQVVLTWTARVLAQAGVTK